MEELFDLVDLNCSCVEKPNNIGANTQEMLVLFKEEFPYYYLDTIDGQCLVWDEDFINKILVVMATGSLEDLSAIEKQVWYQFVEFQDAMSHSADSSVFGAIGCTVPNELGQSFVVTNSGVTSTLCQAPESSIQKERQSKSLDDYLMSLLNCETPNECGIIEGDVTDVSPCSI